MTKVINNYLYTRSLGDIDPEEIRSVDDILDYIVENFESDPVAGYGNNLWSYRQFSDMVKSLASSMIENFPMKKGQRVLIILPPSYQLLLSYFALWRNGVSAIPLDVKTPLELIDKIATSGKISGIITYDSLFSHINRDETSNIYNILTSSSEFRSIISKRNPDMDDYRIRGTRQRAVMEEMCYNEAKEGEHIDIFTDIVISEIQWKKDSSFTFLNYTFKKVISALKLTMDLFPMRKNQAFAVQKEPTSCPDVIEGLLIPILKGERIIMVENFRENLEKIIMKNDPEEGIVLWLNMHGFKILKEFRESTIEKISIILTNFQWNMDEISFLGKKRSSLFSIMEYEGISVPIISKQFIGDGPGQSNFISGGKEKSGVFKIPYMYICDKYEDEEEFYTIANINIESMSARDIENESVYLHRGRSIPLNEMIKFFENQLHVKNCALLQDKDDWRIIDIILDKKTAIPAKININDEVPDLLLPLKIIKNN